MPLYEFKCSACGHTVERLSAFSDRPAPLKDLCPRCSRSTLVRIVSVSHYHESIEDWVQKRRGHLTQSDISRAKNKSARLVKK